jgi:hypothetical protein
MTGLPQSVRDRLAAQQQADSAHPEADMLNAFTEDALSAAERTAMLDHLARCPTCREVVAVAGNLPQQVAHSSVAPKLREKTYWNWNILRWAAPAVAVVVVGAAVVLRDRSHQADEIAPPVHTQTRASDAGVAEQPPAAEKRAPRVELSRPSPTVELQREKKEAAPARELSTDSMRGGDRAMRRSESTDAETSFAMQGAAPNQSKEIGGPLRSEALRDKLGSQQNLRVQEEDSKLKADVAAASPAAPAARTAETVSNRTNDAPPASLGGVAGDSSDTRKDAELSKKTRQAAAAKSTAAHDANTVSVEGSVANYQVDEAFTAPPVAFSWRVAEGHLSKTFNHRDWIAVPLPGAPQISIVATVGPHVWAGGDKGKLFHSIDNGNTWTEVHLGESGKISTEAIRSIQFKDINSGIVTTSSGAEWTTTDAGRTWERK